MKYGCLALLSLLTMLGCSTATVEKNNTKAALDERLLQKSKQMNVSVHGILESDFKGKSCSQLANQVKAKWNWRDAVTAANSCFKSRDLERVEFLAQDLCTKETSTPWGPYFLARVALEKKELDRALWMVDLSIKRAPDFGVIHYLAGQILWERKEYKDSTTEFEKSITYDQGLGPAHLILGQVYLRDQEYDKAAPQFNLALKYLPDNIVALSGQAESQMHLNNPDGALDSYVRLSELDDADGQYWTHIGALYEGPLNNPERALHAYQRLHDLVKSGTVKKNIDPDNDSKIQELQTQLSKARDVASEKKTADKGGAK